MKKEKFVWLQQDDEPEPNYELFKDYLRRQQTISEFANNQILYENSTVLKCATNFNWKKRKLAYLQHTQFIKQNAIDKQTEKSILKAIKPIENVIDKLTEHFIKDIETKIENNTLSIPDGSEMNYLKNLVATLDKLIDCKEKIKTETTNISVEVVELEVVE